VVDDESKVLMKRRKVNAIEFCITRFDLARGLLNPFPAQGIPLLGFLERDYLTLSQLKESLLLGFLEGLPMDRRRHAQRDPGRRLLAFSCFGIPAPNPVPVSFLSTCNPYSKNWVVLPDGLSPG
jgi:hypothetical protein